MTKEQPHQCATVTEWLVRGALLRKYKYFRMHHRGNYEIVTNEGEFKRLRMPQPIRKLPKGKIQIGKWYPKRPG